MTILCPKWRTILTQSAILASSLAVWGCGDSKAKIETANTQVMVLTQSARLDISQAKETGEIGPTALPLINSADTKLQDITGASTQITEALPGVQNKPSWWDSLLGKIAWFGIIGLAVVCVFMLCANFLPLMLAWLVKQIPMMLTWIPRHIRAQAKLDSEALKTAPSDSTLYESVALRRGRSPLYEVAFNNVNRL